MVNVLKFTALWVKHFQLAYNIVFRKIIKFVIKKDTIFIVNLKIQSKIYRKYYKYITRYKIGNIYMYMYVYYNSNQSRFQLKFYSRRYCHPKVPKIHISAITYSYTIQSIVSADDRLLSLLFIVLKETSCFVSYIK